MVTAAAPVRGRRAPAAPERWTPERTDPDYRFDFCGGQLAIDFTNTVGSRGDTTRREEHFRSFGDIVAWAEAAGVVTRRRGSELRAEAGADPAAARRSFDRALELREALYRVLTARARLHAPAPPDLAVLNCFVAELFRGAALVPARDRLVLDTPPGRGLDAVLRPVVRAAVDLLTSPEPKRIGICADDGCAWLFLDSTRSGTRRWCDMKACGNRNKVRRFRESI